MSLTKMHTPDGQQNLESVDAEILAAKQQLAQRRCGKIMRTEHRRLERIMPPR